MLVKLLGLFVKTKSPELKRFYNIISGKNSLALFVSILSAASLVVSNLMTSRLGVGHLSTGELEYWFLMLAAVPFCILLDLGAYSILPGKFSYYSKHVDRSLLCKYLATFTLTAIGIIVAAGVIAGFVGILFIWNNEKLMPGNTSPSFVILLVVAIAARVIQNVLLGVIYSAGNIATEKTLKTIGSIAAVAPMPVLLLNGHSISALPWSWLFSSVIVFIVSGICIYKNIAPIFNFSLFSCTISKEILGTSAQFLVAAIPGLLIYNILPYRVAHDFGSDQTIQIGLVMQISLGVTMLCSIPTSLFVKKIADSYHLHLGASNQNFSLIRNVRLVSVLSSGVLATIYFFSNDIFYLWLGKHIEFDKNFLLLFLLVIWLEIQQSTLTTSLVSTGYVNFWRVNVSSALLTLALYSIFVDQLGFLGVPLACLIAQSFTCHFWNIKRTLFTFTVKLHAYFKLHLKSASLVLAIAFASKVHLLSGISGAIISSCLCVLALIVTFRDGEK